jgi:WXG100 family type VII secretion target
MSVIKLNYGGLDDARRQLVVVAGEIEAKLATLRTELDGLNWSGDAAQAYLRLQTQWDEAAGELARVLGDLAAVLDQVMDNYQATEAGNARLWE